MSAAEAAPAAEGSVGLAAMRLRPTAPPPGHAGAVHGAVEAARHVAAQLEHRDGEADRVERRHEGPTKTRSTLTPYAGPSSVRIALRVATESSILSTRRGC